MIIVSVKYFTLNAYVYHDFYIQVIKTGVYI